MPETASLQRPSVLVVRTVSPTSDGRKAVRRDEDAPRASQTRFRTVWTDGTTVGSDGRMKGRNDGRVGRTDERTERRSGRTDGRKARVGRTRAMFHLLLELSGVRHAFERHQKKVFVELLIGVFVDRPSLFVGIADLDRAIGQFESRDGVALIERRPGDE
jgi:hypothetical protein